MTQDQSKTANKKIISFDDCRLFLIMMFIIGSFQQQQKQTSTLTNEVEKKKELEKEFKETPLSKESQ